MRETRSPKLVQIGREGAHGQIGLRETYGLFFLIFFSRTRLLKCPVGGFYAQ